MKTIKFSSPKKISLNTKTKQTATPLPNKTEQTIKQLDNLVDRSKQVLIRAKSVFPFDFFPDEIIVSRTKIDLIYEVFFKTKEVMTILPKDIETVTMTFSFYLATLTYKVTSKETPPPLKFLKINEAIKVRRIILGLAVSAKENIDLSALSLDDLKKKMEEIGEARE